MIRRTLAWLLALSLALGAAAPFAVAACAAANTAALSAQSEGCNGCNAGDQGQAQQSCPAVFCFAGCISGPATTAAGVPSAVRERAAGPAATLQRDALFARAIPPDHPPPR